MVADGLSFLEFKVYGGVRDSFWDSVPVSLRFICTLGFGFLKSFSVAFECFLRVLKRITVCPPQVEKKRTRNSRQASLQRLKSFVADSLLASTMEILLQRSSSLFLQSHYLLHSTNNACASAQREAVQQAHANTKGLLTALELALQLSADETPLTPTAPTHARLPEAVVFLVAFRVVATLLVGIRVTVMAHSARERKHQVQLMAQPSQLWLWKWGLLQAGTQELA